jgi:eukaryotic-like serine/threonine-protein kinase
MAQLSKSNTIPRRPSTRSAAESISIITKPTTISGRKGRDRKLGIAVGTEPELYAVLLDSVGLVHLTEGDYVSARTAFTKALELNLALFGPRHPSVVDNQLNLAMVFRRLGDVGAAREIIHAALAVIREGNATSAIQEGLLLNELGALELQVNNLAEAEEAATDSERILRASNDPRFTLAMDTQARIKSSCGDHAAAEALYRQMLPVDSQTFLGTRHPRHVAHLHNLATVLQAQGNLGAAKKTYAQTVSLIIELHGRSHPDLADVYANLGRVLQQMGDLAEARRNYLRALELNKTLRGPDHPYVGYDLANLGRLALQNDRPADAEKLLKKALAIYRPKLPQVHGFIAAALNFLGAALIQLGRPDEAEPVLLEALQIWDELAKRCSASECAVMVTDRCFGAIALATASQSHSVDDATKAGLVGLRPSDLRARLARLWKRSRGPAKGR